MASLRLRERLGALTLALGAACAVACGTGASASDAGRSTSIEFRAEINREPFVCGQTYANVGIASSDFTVTDARLYVYDIELVDLSEQTHPLMLDANAYQSRGLALLDFENGCGPDGTPGTHTVVTGVAPELDYQAVRFTLGVPKARNFIDLAHAAPPLDVTGMYWVWQSGYRFLKLDGASPIAGGGIEPFSVHVGASGCPGKNLASPPEGDCLYPNTVTYDLPAFSPTHSSITVDIGDLLADSDLGGPSGGGCLSSPTDPDCVVVFPRIGIGAPEQQRMFRVE